MTTDMVSHPPHYTSHPSGIECIQVTEHMNFNLGNATKYIWRAGLKGDDAVEDLRKAAFYVDREIARLGGESDGGVPESDVPEKVVYEFFGRVSNVQFESTVDATEVELALTPTIMGGVTHRIRFEISRDNSGDVADLLFGKPTCAHRETAPLFRVGDRVRVIKNLSMTGDIPIGTIGKIQAGPDSDGDYEVKFGDGWYHFEPGEIGIAGEPQVGDILTVTDTDGHNFPYGAQVKVDALGGWVGLQPNRHVLCSRTDGAPTGGGMKQQAIRLECTNW